MTFWRKLRRISPATRGSQERDMQEELESLRAMAERNELGNMTLIAEEARRQFTWTWIEQLGQDLRYTARSMAHNKAFTMLAVLSLALGIGANTAIYSFMDSILLRSLPVPNPKALVVMKWRAKGYTLATSGMSWSTAGSFYDPAEGTHSSIFPYPALQVFQANRNIVESAFCYFGCSLNFPGCAVWNSAERGPRIAPWAIPIGHNGCFSDCREAAVEQSVLVAPRHRLAIPSAIASLLLTSDSGH